MSNPKQLDLNNVIYSSTADAYKTTEIHQTSVTVSGALAAGATRTTSSVITLAENQTFAYATALYAEVTKGGAASWQRFPTFDANAPSTPTGFLSAFLNFIITGPVVTFNASIFNPYAGTETFATSTFFINYVTYVISV